MCWEDSEMKMEMQLCKLSENEIAWALQSFEWTLYLKARQKTMMHSLANMRERQLKETRYKPDQ